MQCLSVLPRALRCRREVLKEEWGWARWPALLRKRRGMWARRPDLGGPARGVPGMTGGRRTRSVQGWDQLN
eukprot:5897418-Prymnesium_polylepis.1